MNKRPGSSLSLRYHQMLLNLVTYCWLRIGYMERTLRAKIFIDQFEPREDDICIATYMRSGTTLLQMVVYQLVTDGNMNFEHITNVSPMLEQAIRDDIDISKFPSPRIFKTHAHYKDFPMRVNGRIIYGIRNGMDVASSMFHYFKDYNMPKLEWDDYFKKMFLRNSWFSHVKNWVENKKKFNICYIHYEDLTKNMRQTVEKIAAFLNVPLTEEKLQRVLERCSFEFMKRNEGKFGKLKAFRNLVDDKFIRKGESDKGQFEFSELQKNKFNRLYKKHLHRHKLGYDLSGMPLRK